MKKFISLALVAAMVLSMTLFMASCGGDDTDAGTEKKVTAVLATNLGDKSFNDSANVGIEALKEKGYDAKVVECNTDPDQWEQNLRSAADEGGIVVGVGSELDMIDDVAKDYPDVKFVWVDNTVDEPVENLTCISYKQNEGSYLVGYIAGMMTETDVVGFVGGADIPVINDFKVGYTQGVKDANPDAKVVVNYTGDWNDTNLGAEAAQTQASQGADIIFCAAGGSGNGVILKAKELGIKAIGVDQDQKISMPDYADQILCSMIKDVGTSIVGLIESITEDEANFPGGDVFYAGMDGGYVAVGYGSEDQENLVPEDVMNALEEQKAKIMDGTIKVDTAL